MPDLFYKLLFILIAYLLGSIPTGFLIGKAKGIDIRTQGSNNIGATNTARVLGKKYFLLVTLLDGFKGFILVFLFKFNIIPYDWCLLSPMIYGIVAVIGHVFPIFLKFKGGKAVSTTAGVVFGYAPAIFLIGVIAFTIAYLSTKIISVGSIVAASVVLTASIIISILTNQLTSCLFTQPETFYWPINLWFVIGIIILVSIILLKHKTNIDRLKKHEEKQFDLTSKETK